MKNKQINKQKTKTKKWFVRIILLPLNSLIFEYYKKGTQENIEFVIIGFLIKSIKEFIYMFKDLFSKTRHKFL